MSNPRILHYRDHKNGGQFDGDCYVALRENITDIIYPIKVRFRPIEFDSGFQYIWGIGTGDNQYSLKIVRDTSDYYLRVTYLDVDYDFTSYRIGIIESIIHVTVWINNVTNFVLAFIGVDRDGYSVELSPKVLTSDESTYSVPAVDLTLGATRYMDGAVLTLDAAGHFTGKMFDFETHYSAGGTDRQRLVFYENYKGSDSNTVYDFYEVYDGTIIDRPSDFWGVETDLSDYIREEKDLKVKYRRDDYLVQEYASTKITLFNYFAISIGDTVVIEINNEITWVFNITKTKLVENGHSMELECEDILVGLKNINTMYYASPKTSVCSAVDFKWYSNYIQAVLECDSTSASLFYLLKEAIYYLQYDNILTVDVSNLEGAVDSLYYDYLESIAVTFSKLGYSLGMLLDLNKSQQSDYDSLIYMDTVFREILFHSRIMYYISDGILTFDQIDSGNVSHDPIWNTDPSEFETDKRWNYLLCKVATSWAATYNASHLTSDWDDEYPDLSIYSSFDTDDVVELKANQLSAAVPDDNKNTFNKRTLIPHLWLLIRNATTGAKRTMWNSADSENFLHQLAGILDDQLRKDFEMERITISLTETNSPKYKEKIDDLVNRKTEIYQEVAE